MASKAADKVLRDSVNLLKKMKSRLRKTDLSESQRSNLESATQELETLVSAKLNKLRPEPEYKEEKPIAQLRFRQTLVHVIEMSNDVLKVKFIVPLLVNDVNSDDETIEIYYANVLVTEEQITFFQSNTLPSFIIQAVKLEQPPVKSLDEFLSRTVNFLEAFVARQQNVLLVIKRFSNLFDEEFFATSPYDYVKCHLVLNRRFEISSTIKLRYDMLDVVPKKMHLDIMGNLEEHQAIEIKNVLKVFNKLPLLEAMERVFPKADSDSDSSGA